MKQMTYEEKEWFIKGYVHAKAEFLSKELGCTPKEAEKAIYATITTEISKEIIDKQKRNATK